MNAQSSAARQNTLDARQSILDKIGGAKRDKAEVLAEYSAIPRNYKQAGRLSPEERLRIFEHRLREYDAFVYFSVPASLPNVIAEVLAGRNKSRMAIPKGLPASWLPGGITFLEADDLSAAELDTLDGILSGCTVAIAATGSLVLQNAAGQGPRRLSLVPDYHLCVVEEGQIVETVPEAFAALEKSQVSPTTFISGPSATADIEMTRIKGVHGPRFLDVVIVGAEPVARG